MSSWYHSIKLNERSSNLTTVAYPFGRFRYKRLPFEASPVGDMFQRKMDKIFKDLPNVFGIAGDNLIVGYNSDTKDYDDTMQGVLEICKQVNLKLNKDKCHFKHTQVLFFSEIISRHGVKPDPQKLKTNDRDVSPKKNKKELQAFLGIINYLSKFSLTTADLCKALR